MPLRKVYDMTYGNRSAAQYTPHCDISKTVSIPMELYQSLRGAYFIGYADEMYFVPGRGAWARLYNPPDSGVDLFVNVWTVSDVDETAFRAQFWFNAIAPGQIIYESPTTPTDTAIVPPPVPRVRLQYANDVDGLPQGGIKAFVRRGQPETTLVETENGKLIFPPGGSFLVFLSAPENPQAAASGRVAFGWWEELRGWSCLN